jgi:hypothetical protein
MSKTTNKIPPEMCERAVLLVLDENSAISRNCNCRLAIPLQEITRLNLKRKKLN